MLNRVVYRGSHGHRAHRPLVQILTRGAVIAALALVGLTVVPSLLPTASAAIGDGLVTVRVVQEVNANGLVDSSTLEPPLIGVDVTFTDAAGNSQTVPTDSTGRAMLPPPSPC